MSLPTPPHDAGFSFAPCACPKCHNDLYVCNSIVVGRPLFLYCVDCHEYSMLVRRKRGPSRGEHRAMKDLRLAYTGLHHPAAGASGFQLDRKPHHHQTFDNPPEQANDLF